ncbi:hypothetical protein [Streptomyces sp. NPDC048650]|uniref:hypothetical protein n=1 Tax=unclassified Streptomyces TaxID=2593676 RepID=UPI003718BB92
MPEPIVRDRTDTPAVALGPTALTLGVLSTGAWVPPLVLAFPWTIIAGALAVTFGLSGIHYARHGIGRLWIATAGTILGALGIAGVITLIWEFSL